MINWFGDANGYVGDPGVRPEVVHTVSTSFALHDAGRKDRAAGPMSSRYNWWEPRRGAIDPLRNEPKTPGYALLNLRSGYEWENFQINLGIENLFDKRYYHPLGGVDYSEWTRHKSTGQVGALPAPGRSFNAAVTVKF